MRQEFYARLKEQSDVAVSHSLEISRPHAVSLGGRTESERPVLQGRLDVPAAGLSARMETLVSRIRDKILLSLRARKHHSDMHGAASEKWKQ
jgi:hypothetical protein